jgi:hypothetical protein
MLAKPLLSRILRNDALTRGLGDPEARVLIEWLVERAEECAVVVEGEDQVRAEVERLCRRGHALGRFVLLWTTPRERCAAVQLAATERFIWPLPSQPADPCELMQDILSWETTVQRARMAALAP